MTPVRHAVFGLLLAGVLVAQALLVWSSIARNALWEDEAFNLTVPANLLTGLGYTSDGLLSGSTPTPFDARISTGPVVLLPVAAALAAGGDLVIGARIVPALFYAALLAAAWVVGRRAGGRWAGLAALCAPLAFDGTRPPSPLQGPADVLGEVAAAALLLWALVALARRPWLAGLLIGLAIQAKYIAFLAVPAFVVAMLLRPGSWRARVRSLGAPAALVAAPTLLMELAALVSLGPAGYVEHLRATVGFLRSGGQEASTSVDDKLLLVAGSWWLPAGLVIGLVVVLGAVGVWALVLVVREPALRERVPSLGRGVSLVAALEPLVVAVLGVGAVLGWWVVLATHTPLWIRHPAPGLLAFVPVLAAYAVVAVRVVAARTRVVAVVAGGALAGVLAAQVGVAASVALARPDALRDQRDAAARVAALGYDRIATDWGGTLSIVVLSGARAVLVTAPADVVDGLPRLHWAESCGEEAPVLVTAPYIVCAP